MSVSAKQPAESADKMRDSARLQMLYEVSNMLKEVEADGLNIDHILSRVLSLAVGELKADRGSIFVVDEAEQVQYAWHIHDGKSEMAIKPFTFVAVDRGLAGWVLREGQPVIINDTLNDPRWAPKPNSPDSEQPWSAICVPLLNRQQVIGVLTTTKPDANQFSQADLDLLYVIASQAAVTVTNASLYTEAQRRIQVMELLNEASQAVNSSLDINEVMQSLLAKMNELLTAEAISIALVDPITDELTYEVAEGIGSDKIVGLRVPRENSISGWVLTHGEPAQVDNPAEDPRFYRLADQLTGFKSQAMICAPLKTKGKVLGTIQAINPRQGRFRDEDLQLLVNLANLAASGIANARQFAATQAAEARYVGLFEDSSDPITLTTLAGVITETNRRTCEMLGYRRQELIGRRMAELHQEKDAHAFQFETTDDEELVFTSIALTRDGRQIPVEVYVKRFITGEQELLQWIHHDISEQLALEQMRTELTAMLFHDLQSPLGNVISSLELIEYEIPPESGQTSFTLLNIAMQSSRRLQSLIHSLLDINRLEEGRSITDKKWVDLNQLLNEAHELIITNLEKRRIVMHRQIPEDAPSVFVDEDMIRRVLLNLLDNALKYSTNDSAITVSAAVAPMADMVHVAVSDQGEGIPKRFQKVIFEKYQRVKDKGPTKGLGLGLAFCRLAVEAHGGRIWVDDNPGGGARFNFTLPLTEQYQAAADAEVLEADT